MSPDVSTLGVPRIGGKLTKSYSAGDLLGAATDDYDTPSGASDYDTPTSHSQETSFAQNDAKSKTLKIKTGKKIKNFFKRDQRRSVATLDQDLYDTPTPSKSAEKSVASRRKTESAEKSGTRVEKSKKVKNQLNPEDCKNHEDDYDSSLSDYDVPYSSPVPTNQNTGRYVDTRTVSSALGVRNREKIECPLAVPQTSNKSTVGRIPIRQYRSVRYNFRI